MKKNFTVLALCLVTAINLYAQNYTNAFFWNLMDEKVYDYILGESSGDMAYYHVMEMAPYERDRTIEQYNTMHQETAYILRKLKEYGLPGAKIETYGKTPAWDGISASLWEVSPRTAKIADYLDMTAILGSGSKDADVKAELVWIGAGTPDEIRDADVRGKIVLTEASAARVHDLAINAGALGVVTFNTPRPLVDPIQVPNSGIRGDKATFAFQLPPREGYPLKNRLLNGEKITVHAKVKTQQVETDNQVTTCYIPGTDPNAEEIVFVAHLFEGYVKLGANDNLSGSAALLEAARTLNKLINEGSIQRPKRSMRFVWANEFSGTGPWVQNHKEITSKALCAINLDMVGLWLSKSESYYCLHRTTMSNPHYLNDVSEAFFHYMGITNKAFVSTGVGRPDQLKPAFSLTGSHDPFYYSINAHYGASDHEVFNDWGVQVPSVIMITWPDNYYHTSGDRPSILDPTQMKRAVILAAVTGYYIAAADDDAAVKIAGEVASNSVKRLALYQARGSAYINEAGRDNLMDVYKRARYSIDALKLNETETLQSVIELAPDNSALNAYIVSRIKDISANCVSAQNSLEEIMRIRAAELGVILQKRISLTTPEESDAAKIFPKTTAKVMEAGYGVNRLISRELQQKYAVNLPNSGEAAKLTITGTHSLLDIKKMLDAQFPQTVDLNELKKYMEMLQEAGLVTF